jgi:hypothetical protein
MKSRIIYVGFEPREATAFAVACHSLRRHCTQPIRIIGLELMQLREKDLYWRDHGIAITKTGAKQIWDRISDAPQATEFANSRFLVPHLARDGLAMFIDCDILCRHDVKKLFDIAENDPSKAVHVVKHDYVPQDQTKMDDQIQTRYPRKLWSSVMIFDCDHPANRRLLVDDVNNLPGRDLHRFCWLEDSQIGALPENWNWLPGHSSHDLQPAIVHYTEGGPWLEKYECAPFAGEWQAEVRLWGRSGK